MGTFLEPTAHNHDQTIHPSDIASLTSPDFKRETLRIKAFRTKQRFVERHRRHPRQTDRERERERERAQATNTQEDRTEKIESSDEDCCLYDGCRRAPEPSAGFVLQADGARPFSEIFPQL